MIVTMSKYYFVLHHSQHEAFLEKLQDLGLVDITTTGWEPTDADRALLSEIDKHRDASTRLREIIGRPGYVATQPFASGEEAYTQFVQAASQIESTTAQIARAEKEAEELKVWGDFSPADLQKLGADGVTISYFSAYQKEFDSGLEKWNEQYLVIPISTVSGVVYFVVVSTDGLDVAINATPIKAPSATYLDKEKEVEQLRTELAKWNDVLVRCASNVDQIEEHGKQVKESLQFNQVASSGKVEADGTLIVMEAWATRETSDKVDAMLTQYPDLIYLKSDPTPEDETPVLLKNNKFSRLFELIGNFYALPKYGTMDLTPFFAPFYMLFFGFCLGDGGYGLVFVLAGLALKLKGGPKLSQVAGLTMLCGGATMVFGALTGSFFGIQLAELPAFAQFREYILTPDRLFTLAIALGIVQILFGMVLKVIVITMQFGFKYALAVLGWIIMIVSTLTAMMLPKMGLEGFSFDSTAYMIVAGVGLAMMLFLNNPNKNPLANFGAGLWNTYNDVTGLMGDILSYIRLFAIGLSGSILALVFNDLAFGLSPEIPVVREIVIVIILLIGHGINLFMSTLSSFVHPMRLTFVEFYKNAGFDASQRAFTPFKRN